MTQYELKPERLKKKCDYNSFDFEKTSELNYIDEIIGQNRAIKALEFGLKVAKKGYNIFISGAMGTGKNSYANSIAHRAASHKQTPSDWCYIYNFVKNGNPKAIQLPSGMGVLLKSDMEKLVSRLLQEIPEVLTSDYYEKTRTSLFQKLQKQQNEIQNSMNEVAKEKGFVLKSSEKGVMTIPLNDEGKPMEEDEFQQLSSEELEDIEEKTKELNYILLDAVKNLRQIEKDVNNELESIEKELIEKKVEECLQLLIEKYQELPDVIEYLGHIKEDILKNKNSFRGKEEKNQLELYLLKDNRARDVAYKYRVNVLVDYSEAKGAPVVNETNPTYYNLMGRMEYEPHLGSLTTDYMKIKAGSLHKANGGYLILQCRDLLANVMSWYAIKRALKTGEIYIENLAEQVGIVPTAALKPEPIPLDVKILLLGSEREYRLLYHYDEDFHKLFKIKSDFDVVMDRNKENIFKIAQFITCHCEQEGLRHFTKDAVGAVVEYSARLADNQNKLSTRFNDLMKIIYEADTWAELDGEESVQEIHIKKAIKEKNYRSNKVEKRMQELIDKNVILIDTQSKVIGQVNGLAVLDMGDYAFGKPSRITVNTFVGQKGIVNIEREVKLSGATHDKGVLILSGYLGEKLGSKQPLSFSASICFEQQYDGVDGDSASSTELYALLSSLAGVPIKQSIAVTGSVNQKGLIQPIGGVNQKIEGFFEVCKNRGLTGEQGVIIPEQNITNLMLDDEVVEAVKKGEFHIYAVSKIEEGIEILTGMSAGTMNDKGNYPADSIFGKAKKRLAEMYKATSRQNNSVKR